MKPEGSDHSDTETEAPSQGRTGGFVVEPLLLPQSSIHRTRPSKQRLAEIAAETVACCQRGWYTNEELEQVPISTMEAAKESTTLHQATNIPSSPRSRQLEPSIVSIVCASTLVAAKALAEKGLHTCVLNFASAKHPGGGFLRGANAQEESLARSTGLYTCLLKAEVQHFYAENARDKSCVYTDNMIMSKAVPVIRSDDGNFLASPYVVDVLTAAAPNMGEAAGRPSAGGVEAIKAARRKRMERLLQVIASHGCDAVVLGAWGCGVFKNDPAEVANEFRELLVGKFSNVFPKVVFAIVDEPTHAIFENVFSGVPLRCVEETSITARKAEGVDKKHQGGSSRRWGKGNRKNASRNMAGFAAEEPE
eukprot:gnl/TRDRNA2_/TRDRNA2_182528_c0_seq1.p1 gnl/TRDRNA2_/TRDRNA2_182528_c0~~gnl/TRDRNA2_/TRDRNA2_182528_c0_seq1.p1  ORF type:complete len:364 (+),score=73.85 gnl/TRDRNA2_/TRDRNA2_182528_c0_seq1:101-1192(+)